MIAPSFPDNESSRLRTLQNLNLLDTPSEERFDRLTTVASRLFGVPIALVSLVDEHRQWFKSKVGLNACETGRDISFCGHAILQDEPLIVEDALEDPRFADNPLVIDDPNIRFYAGCPLNHPDGDKMGTLCLISPQPHSLSDAQIITFKELARLVELELVQAASDTLDIETQLTNKEGFNQLGCHVLSICKRIDTVVSVAFIYAKGLTSVKYHLGTQVYQDTIDIIAKAFKHGFCSSDLVARYDENSFVSLMANANEADAQLTLNQISNQIKERLEPYSNDYSVEILAGLVQSSPDVRIEDLVFRSFTKLHEQDI